LVSLKRDIAIVVVSMRIGEDRLVMLVLQGVLNTRGRLTTASSRLATRPIFNRVLPAKALVNASRFAGPQAAYAEGVQGNRCSKAIVMGQRCRKESREIR
jgi:hypothetical protein